MPLDRRLVQFTLRGALLLATLTLESSHCLAQVPLPTSASLGVAAEPASPATPSDAEASARKHFESALELYRAGRYAPALTELKQAAALDPNGKDLFFNLALVHEKLGQLREAISALERFRELELDAAERERAQATIQRLRGAARAADSAPPANEPCASPAAPEPGRGPDPVLIGAASVGVVSLIVGAVFGIKALSDDVSSERTSPSLSAEALRARGQRAEREALVADIAFAITAASAGTFIGVWALSPADAKRQSAGVTLQGAF